MTNEDIEQFGEVLLLGKVSTSPLTEEIITVDSDGKEVKYVWLEELGTYSEKPF